jgi:serpin B
MKKFELFLLALFLLTTIGCEQIITGPGEGQPLQLSKAEQEITKADNIFGWTVLKHLTADDPTANQFISPLSISMALGMTLNGARNQTYTDMKNVLGYADMSRAEVNQAYQHLIELLTNLDPEVMFEIANSIWTRDGLPVEQDFYDVNRSYFDAEVRMLDFSLPAAPDIINSWIADKTHNKIEEVIESIHPLVVMYLINAIYFNGTWTYEFDKEHTAPRTFYLADNSTIETPMMRQTNDFLYY